MKIQKMFAFNISLLIYYNNCKDISNNIYIYIYEYKTYAYFQIGNRLKNTYFEQGPL